MEDWLGRKRRREAAEGELEDDAVEGTNSPDTSNSPNDLNNPNMGLFKLVSLTQAEFDDTPAYVASRWKEGGRKGGTVGMEGSEWSSGYREVGRGGAL